MKKISLYLTLLLFLSSCLQQELKIVLNSDGSGEYHIKKEMGKELSTIVGMLPDELKKESQKNKEKIQQLPGGVKIVVDKTYTHPEDVTRIIEEQIYIFSNLGEALPVLEDLVEMGPRYKYENGKFIVFRNREVDEWTQFSDDDRMKNAYFKLTIELPQKPESKNGIVKGNTVSWSFDAEFLKKYKKMEIGQNIIEATIAETGIKTDIRPRLVVESDKKEDTEYKPLHSFSSYIPIVGKKYSNSGDATLAVFFDVENIDVPFSYKDLKITKILVDGKEVSREIKSDESGVFDGTNGWSDKLKGFPLSLIFPAENPWIKNIEILEATLNIGKVLKSKEITYPINIETTPTLLSNATSSYKIALTDLNLKSSLLASPSIEFVSNYEPNMLKSFYIDTYYGLRYKNTIYRQKKLSEKKFYNKAKTDFINNHFPDKDAYFYEIGFTKIPKPPLNLVFEIIEKQSYKPVTLTLENISVSN
jgi:hypothetical protein